MEIIVTIGPDGQVSVEAKGLKGTGCVEATRALQEALGQTVSDAKTAEYHQHAQQQRLRH